MVFIRGCAGCAGRHTPMGRTSCQVRTPVCASTPSNPSSPPQTLQTLHPLHISAYPSCTTPTAPLQACAPGLYAPSEAALRCGLCQRGRPNYDPNRNPNMSRPHPAAPRLACLIPCHTLLWRYPRERFLAHARCMFKISGHDKQPYCCTCMQQP